jgi:hypothetical protein
LLVEEMVLQWAFVTAYNPGAQLLADYSNSSRQEELCKAVEQLGYSYLHGYGVGTITDWPPEDSILILGIDREQAESLGGQYGQKAIVVGRYLEPAKLIWLSPTPNCPY